MRFVPGDIFFVPRGLKSVWNSRSRERIVLLDAGIPPDPDGSSEEPARRRVRRLGNAWESAQGLKVDSSGAEILFRQGAWRVEVRRMPPGGVEVRAARRDPPFDRIISFVLRGSAATRIQERGLVFYSLEGDAYSVEKVGYRHSWSFENPGLSELVELRLVEETRERIRPPAAPMTSTTGKAVGGWPPMMIR